MHLSLSSGDVIFPDPLKHPVHPTPITNPLQPLSEHYSEFSVVCHFTFLPSSLPSFPHSLLLSLFISLPPHPYILLKMVLALLSQSFSLSGTMSWGCGITQEPCGLPLACLGWEEGWGSSVSATRGEWLTALW